MVVSEYNLTFGNKDRKINVFCCLKYKTNGNQYILYSNDNPNENKIYYGSVHMNPEKLVVMSTKVQEELIKEFLDKIIDQTTEDFQFLDIKDRTKVEIISENNLEVAPEIITKLIDISIPKPQQVVQNQEPQKGSGLKRILVILILSIIGGLGYYIYTNQGKFFGYGSEYICVKTYAHETLKAIVTEKITLTYDRYSKYQGVTINTAYQFENYDVYYNFKNKGEYFEYMPADFDEDDGYRLEDDTNTYRTIINKDVTGDFFMETEFDKIETAYTDLGYTCTIQEKVE